MNKSEDIFFSKRNVNSRLERIANVLLLNASFIDNLGLLNGKMGIAIFFYQYYRLTGNKNFEDYAGELIDEIYDKIDAVTPINFEDGLTGIGWGIEYLVKNNFVQADTDEALSEIDVALNRISNITTVLINDQDRFFNLVYYYIARLYNLQSSKEKVKTYIKKDKLGIIISECERFVLQKQLLKCI